ncbi:site-specific DNA-methyltransferase [Bartonella sp. TT110JLCBS]|uniref:site-specific DNA-methyltransferase n=1 Tax=Bartonella sp. TT110JLCBS TaxID=3243578 RepID=UPI0035CEE225
MSRNKQKLELNWIGKEKRPKLEPRILLEDLEKSYHASRQISSQDIFDNKLIFGDNLLALKALEQEYTGKVKCIYIDPPYNTGNAFEHYEDGLEHSLWLSLMRDRLELLHRLLAEDGSIWISIDDNEQAYLKVMMDEIFGRKNFIIQSTIKRSAPTGHKAINPAPVQVADYLLAYAKRKKSWSYKPQYAQRNYDYAYNKYIDCFEEGIENWKIINLKDALHRLNLSLEQCLQIFPERIIRFAQPNFKGVGKETQELILHSQKYPKKIFIQSRPNHADIYLLRGERILFYKDKLKEIDGNLVTAELLTNIWLDIPYQGIAREGGVVFPKSKKPEKLLRRILNIATNPGDLVLDSFAGSGTTGAVAHKMGRKWIMIELGEHCHTHIIPRLKKVIDGTDQGGISKSVNWQGGGGFRYYRLAPSLLQKDPWGQWIIRREYNATMLSEAMCKHMGFTYAPDENHYWMQGYSTETDYIYVTTSAMTYEQLRIMSEEVGSHRTLLICCTAFDTKTASFENLTLTKIPRAVLEKCEWGRDDYSLNVANLEPMIVVKESEKDKDIAQQELDLFE